MDPELDRQYNGRRIGVYNGRPLVLVTDPCLEAEVDKPFNARRIGVYNGRPLVLVTKTGSADGEPELDRHYNGRRIGVYNGRPLVLVTGATCEEGCEETTTIKFIVEGCGGNIGFVPLPGITVELQVGNESGGEVDFLTQATDVNGEALFDVTSYFSDPDYLVGGELPYEWQIEHPRWETESGTGLSIACGENDTVTVPGMTNPAEGYVCTDCCPWPIRDTLTFTNQWGSVTLNWNGFNGWEGTQTIGPFSGVESSTLLFCSGCETRVIADGESTEHSVEVLWGASCAFGFFGIGSSNETWGGLCYVSTDGTCHDPGDCDHGPWVHYFGDPIPFSGWCDSSPNGELENIVCDGTTFSATVELEMVGSLGSFGSGTLSEP
jgi:hypothetical protein